MGSVKQRSEQQVLAENETTASKRRKVLIVSYRFPPEARAGSIRAYKLVKYLRQHGWEPIVLTVSNPRRDWCDDQVLGELPDELAIYRAPRLEAAQISENLQRWFGRFGVAVAWRLETLMRSLVLPDASGLWQPGALFQGIRACIRHRPDAIFSTAYPVSNNVVGWLLSRLFSIPWVADYRDLWVQEFEYKPVGVLHRIFDARLERAMLHAASYTLTTAPESTAVMRRVYPEASAKIITVPNGFDPADTPGENLSKHKSGDPVVFVHVGTLYSSRSAGGLIAALDALLRKRPDLAGRVQLRLVGEINNAVPYVGPLDLVCTGWVSRTEAQKEVAAADVCVLIQHQAKGGQYPIPQKLYDYLAFGRTILSLGGTYGTAVQRLISNAGGGVFVDQSAPQDLEPAVEKLVIDRLENTLKVERNQTFLEEFSRTKIAGRVAAILEAAVVGEEKRSFEFDFGP